MLPNNEVEADFFSASGGEGVFFSATGSGAGALGPSTEASSLASSCISSTSSVLIEAALSSTSIVICSYSSVLTDAAPSTVGVSICFCFHALIFVFAVSTVTVER